MRNLIIEALFDDSVEQVPTSLEAIVLLLSLAKISFTQSQRLRHVVTTRTCIVTLVREMQPLDLLLFSG